MMDAEFMESLYKKEELVPGKTVELPWETGGKTEVWKGVIIESSTEKTPCKFTLHERPS